MTSVFILPHLNAILNATSEILLAIRFSLVRRGKERASQGNDLSIGDFRVLSRLLRRVSRNGGFQTQRNESLRTLRRYGHHAAI
jgi:predicted component of type VI protein secretion system